MGAAAGQRTGSGSAAHGMGGVASQPQPLHPRPCPHEQNSWGEGWPGKTSGSASYPGYIRVAMAADNTAGTCGMVRRCPCLQLLALAPGGPARER